MRIPKALAAPAALLQLLAMLLAAQPVSAQELGLGADTDACGAPVLVAAFEWEPAQLAAAVVAKVLAQGFGCAATTAPASPPAALERVAAGLAAPLGHFGADAEDADEPRPWVRLVAPGVSAGAARAAGAATGAPLFSGEAQAGWWAPAWFAATHPDVLTLADAVAAPEIFAASPGARPKLYICPAHWSCNAQNLAVIDALDARAVFDIVTPESGDALTEALLQAAAARQPWLGYYWSPSAALAETPMRLLSPGALDVCADGADASCERPFELPPAVTAFAPTLDDEAPRVAAFLRAFSIPAEDALEVMAWKTANNASDAQAADQLIRSNPGLWRVWLDDEARRRLEDSLIATD